MQRSDINLNHNITLFCHNYSTVLCKTTKMKRNHTKVHPQKVFSVYRQNFRSAPPKKKDQFRSLRVLFNIGRYLCVLPFNLDGSLKAKFIALVLVLLYSVYFVISINKFIQINRDSITQLIMYSLTLLFFYFELIICLLSSNVYRRRNWIQFFELVYNLEKLVVKFKFDVAQNVCFVYAELLILCIFWLTLHFYELLHWIEYKLYDLCIMFCGWKSVDYYMMFLSLLIANVALHLKRIYNKINLNIVGVVKSGTNEKKIVWDLQNKVKILKCLESLVTEFNSIFGWHMFFYINIILMYLLNACLYLLKTEESDDVEKRVYLSVTVTYTVSL